MKAYVLKANGGPENLMLKDIPDPVISDGSVLVKVKAISINPVDVAVRKDYEVFKTTYDNSEPAEGAVIGWDVSGTVVETGIENSELKGKDVFGMINFPGKGRAYAEMISTPINQVAVKPHNISHAEAAAATLAALTAWQALIWHAKVKQEDKVLIHSAAGGVGHYAVQIAKSLGAYVVGTASDYNRQFVLDLGAEEFIDYNKENFEERIRDASVIFDSVSQDSFLKSVKTVAPGGRVISIRGMINDEIKKIAEERNVFIHRFRVRSNGEDMKRIAHLLENEKIKSHLSKIYSFGELQKAHQQVESRKTRGKIVVKL